MHCESLGGFYLARHSTRACCYEQLLPTCAPRAARSQADRDRFAKLGADESGRGAATVYRDRASGKRVTADELAAAAEKEKKPKSETPAWGGGIAQVCC